MVVSSKKTAVLDKTVTGSEVKKATAKKVAANTGLSSKKSAATSLKKTEAKVTTRKPAVKKEVAPKTLAVETKLAKAAVVKKSAPRKKAATVTPEQRYHMISTAAYFLAERRGFAGGYEMQDWISAEAEIDAKLNSN